MTRKIPLLALGFGMALASAQAFAHGNHSHGPALTEVERQASEGIFADKDVQDRALSDWEGVWQSVNPYLLNGDLDPVLEQKAKKPGGKSVEEYRAYYKKGYATDVEQIGIEDDVIEFHVGQTVNSCKYRYSCLLYTSPSPRQAGPGPGEDPRKGAQRLDAAGWTTFCRTRTQRQFAQLLLRGR